MLHMKQVSKDSRKIGSLGETVACEYLQRSGFTIIERNYSVPAGEIDIICSLDATIHFVEVKSVSYETKDELYDDILHGKTTPAERVTPEKLLRIQKAIVSWLSKAAAEDKAWQISVLEMRIVSRETYATANLISLIT